MEGNTLPILSFPEISSYFENINFVTEKQSDLSLSLVISRFLYNFRSSLPILYFHPAYSCLMIFEMKTRSTHKTWKINVFLNLQQCFFLSQNYNLGCGLLWFPSHRVLYSEYDLVFFFIFIKILIENVFFSISTL